MTGDSRRQTTKMAEAKDKEVRQRTTAGLKPKATKERENENKHAGRQMDDEDKTGDRGRENR